MPDRIRSLFPTTVMVRHLEGMEGANPVLAAIIRQIEASQPNSDYGTSTRGGFQTPESLLRADHPQAGNPAMMMLKQNIAQAMQDYAGLLIRQECASPPAGVNFASWGWGVILRSGNWQGHHVHPNANISGVYYVSAPAAALEDDSDAGKLSFYDPRPRANMAQLLTQVTRNWEAPIPGDMVLFPSWLEHSVAPFQGDGERICIAFNIKLEMT